LIKKEDEQCESSNRNSDYEELSNTNGESKEHDSDECNIYIMSKGKDEDVHDGEE
jgi:hypothetical protein